MQTTLVSNTIVLFLVLINLEQGEKVLQTGGQILTSCVTESNIEHGNIWK